jgi:opacity protein-like surface antigen
MSIMKKQSTATYQLLIALALFSGAAIAQEAQDVHPIMESKWWVNAGAYLPERSFKASASASAAGIDREFDFEGSLGLKDDPSVFMAELGWQFGEKWGAALQYFNSSREGGRTLDETFEWQDNTYEVGAVLEAETNIDITRVFFARRFLGDGPHSLRLGAGLHWIELGATVAGQATLDDQSTEFRRSSASASLPVPNIGAWYRYSPSNRWLLNARVDWLDASIDNYSGAIWNVSGGVNYRLSNHVGVGVSYQFFQLAGGLKEENWKGDITTTFKGPYLFVNGFW